ncbi:hypothetical protein FACS1894206_02880 [Deltaproteobacteria bacterium]|nr:hypothetical protein FACS1894206_02880 [Deltaproteobacteria bacterium]
MRVKLPFSILAAFLLIFSIATIFIAYTANSVISRVRTSRIEEASLAVGSHISTQIQYAGKNLALLASVPAVLKGIGISPASFPAARDRDARAALTAMLNRSKQTYEYYASLWLMNDAGETVAGDLPLNANSNTTMLSSEWLTQIMKKNSFLASSSLISGVTGDPLVLVSLKVVHNGLSGALAGALQLSKNARPFLRETSGDGRKAYVIGMDGSIVASVDGKTGAEGGFGSSDWFPKMRERVSGSIVTDIDGEQTTIGFYHIPQTHLYSIVIADAAYMRPYADIIRNAAIASAVVGALLAMGCVCLFLFPVIAGIIRLNLFARQINMGSETAAIDLARKDELGDLASNLNDMIITLTEKIKRSQAAHKAKSGFLARMSHEIRTPMNGIIGMTYLALKENPDDRQRKFLGRIDAAAKNLLDILNNILDFSKIEANELDMTIHSFRLSDVLQTAYSLFQPAAGEKHIALKFRAADDVPDILEGDARRLTQVISNICSNALKFTETGSISLNVSLRERGEDGNLLLFSIKDTGAGMTYAAQRTIFEAFSAPDAFTTRKYGGTGLGLAICRSLTRMMGGDMWVESEIGVGSTFFFTILARESKESDLEDAFVSGGKDDAENIPLPLHILLAEDDAMHQEIAAGVLRGIGATVKLARNGAEAVQLWEEGDFDIILMDIQMPEMDGLTAARTIRGSAKNSAKTVPIIAMTANALSGDREKSIDSGMNDHVTKPLDVPLLRRVLARWSTAV